MVGSTAHGSPSGPAVLGQRDKDTQRPLILELTLQGHAAILERLMKQQAQASPRNTTFSDKLHDWEVLAVRLLEQWRQYMTAEEAHRATRLAVATIIVALDLVEFFYQASILISEWVVTGDPSSAFQLELLRQAILYAPFRILRRGGSAEEAGMALREKLSEVLEAELRYSSEALKPRLQDMEEELLSISRKLIRGDKDALLKYGRDYSRVHLTPQFLHWAHSLLRQHASPLAISIYNQPLPPMTESHSPSRAGGRPSKTSSGKGKEKSRRAASPEPDARPAATQSPAKRTATKPSATTKQSGESKKGGGAADRKTAHDKAKTAAEPPSMRKTKKDKETGNEKGKGKKKGEEEEEEEEEESDEGRRKKAVQTQKGRSRRNVSPSAPRRATRSTSANAPPVSLPYKYRKPAAGARKPASPTRGRRTPQPEQESDSEESESDEEEEEEEEEDQGRRQKRSGQKAAPAASPLKTRRQRADTGSDMVELPAWVGWRSRQRVLKSATLHKGQRVTARLQYGAEVRAVVERRHHDGTYTIVHRDDQNNRIAVRLRRERITLLDPPTPTPPVPTGSASKRGAKKKKQSDSEEEDDDDEDDDDEEEEDEEEEDEEGGKGSGDDHDDEDEDEESEEEEEEESEREDTSRRRQGARQEMRKPSRLRPVPEEADDEEEEEEERGQGKGSGGGAKRGGAASKQGDDLDRTLAIILQHSKAVEAMDVEAAQQESTRRNKADKGQGDDTAKVGDKENRGKSDANGGKRKRADAEGEAAEEGKEGGKKEEGEEQPAKARVLQTGYVKYPRASKTDGAPASAGAAAEPPMRSPQPSSLGTRSLGNWASPISALSPIFKRVRQHLPY